MSFGSRVITLGLAVLTLYGASGAVVLLSRSSDKAFERVAEQYYATALQRSPSFATSVGLHRYDDRLDDMSAQSFADGSNLDRSVISKLKSIDPGSLSADVAIDRTLLMNWLQDDLLTNDTLAQWKHNPDSYTSLASGAILGLIQRNFAPPEQRMKDVISRERDVPRLLQQGRENITTVDAVTKQIAYSDAVGAVDFFKNTVPQAFESVGTTSLRAQFRQANAAAAAATQSYAAFIKGIRPSGTFGIGKKAYEKRLKYEDALNISVDQYLRYGEKALAQSRSQYIAVAKVIDSSRKPGDVYASLAKSHPAPSQLLRKATSDLHDLHSFIIAHHIVTLPREDNIKVLETPQFERAFVTAQEQSPGPFETRATQAYYFVTPADLHWSKERQEQFLGQFNSYQGPIISLHEVYPGHYVNFTINRFHHLSNTRNLFTSSEFAEGWAHYSEQMMVDEGWGGGDPRVRLAQLDEALLRECRFIAGVKLHTAGWTLKQAENLFTGSCFQSPAVAEEESLRGTQDPMYGYYTLGKMMILKLREDYKKKLGSKYTLQKFHDELLAHGDPPLPLLRPILLGKEDDGKAL